MFYITTQPKTCWEQEPMAEVAPTEPKEQSVDLSKATIPTDCYSTIILFAQ